MVRAMNEVKPMKAQDGDESADLTLSLRHGRYASTLEHCGGRIIKLTKIGYQGEEEAIAEADLFQKMHGRLAKIGIFRPLYLCVDASELTGISLAARRSMAEDSRNTASDFGAIASYGINPILSLGFNLFQRLRWNMDIRLLNTEEESLSFLLERMDRAEETARNRQEKPLVATEAKKADSPKKIHGTSSEAGQLSPKVVDFLNTNMAFTETVTLGGFEQQVMEPPAWIYASSDNQFRFQAVLVGGDTILSTIRGRIDEDAVQTILKMWRSIFSDLPGLTLSLVHDCLGVTDISLIARRHLLDSGAALNVNVPFQAVVSDEKMDPLVSWAKFNAHDLLNSVSFSDSLHVAFEMLRQSRHYSNQKGGAALTQQDPRDVSYLFIDREQVTVFSPPRWHLSVEGQHPFNKLSLLGKDTLLIESFGERTPEHTKALLQLLGAVLDELGDPQMHLIQLDHGVNKVSPESTRLRIAHFRATRTNWLSTIHIGTTVSRKVLTLVEPVFSAIGHRVIADKTLSEAWRKIRALRDDSKDKVGNPVDPIAAESLPVRTLLEVQQTQLQEYEQSCQKLLQGMMQITWDQDESSWSPEVEAPGPFAPVFSALQLLQRDISAIMTERDRRENQLAMAQIEAEAANRVKTEFLATMSHELRTPLTPILGLIEKLQSTPLDSDQLRAVDGIERAAVGLLHQVSDLLDFATMGAGKLRLNSKPCDLRALISSAAELHSQTAEEKGLSITLTGEEELPPLVLVDPGRFQQVLDNLMSNAIKFTDKGSVAIAVNCLDTDIESKLLRLRVQVIDTGTGVTPAESRTIFTRFNRGKEAGQSVRPGVGLGLAISQNIIQHMGGMIGLETSDIEGSTFWFQLDLPVLELDEAAASIDAAPTVAAYDEELLLSGRTLLVVEDNKDIRELTSEILRGVGGQTLLAQNGSEALEQVLKERIDLILMDCKMPLMDGYETTEELRRLEGVKSCTPVVALTAYALGEERERCFAAGMNDYLTKPFSRAQLLEVVARNLSQEIV